MKRVCFLLPDAAIKPTSLFSAIEVLDAANWFYNEKGKPSFYDLEIVGVNRKQVELYSRITGNKVFHDYTQMNPDIIIIPGLQEDRYYSGKENRAVLKWICDRYKSGSEVMSLCTGAFFLAATGLLNGKECSTHWNAVDTFTKLFPEVVINAEKIITDSKGIYTAGGATSSLNLMLYLVEKFNGRQAALYCSKMLAIDIDRDSQSQFVMFEGQKQHEDEAIKKVQNYIERNIDERISVEFLAGKFNMSKRSFIRRFKKATNNVPIEYVQKVRIEAAKRRLESNAKSINEVMYSVGYSDTKAFRNIFIKVAGLSPAQYKAKFGR
jgi:transcriptional regulator GlxA family with amidase domain